jgi:hypothetical protein
MSPWARTGPEGIVSVRAPASRHPYKYRQDRPFEGRATLFKRIVARAAWLFVPSDRDLLSREFTIRRLLSRKGIAAY